MTTRADVVAEARTWLGTRWHHRGRIKGVGCDCAGLLIGVARELGLSTYEAVGYSRTPNAGELERHCSAAMLEIDRRQMSVGDVALLSWGADPQHLGIIGDHPAGGLTLIHAWASARKVVEHALDETWRARIVSAYAIPGLD